jgi:hydroxymethylpyrimidine kinase/phosphomethylpyrimidine kinase
LNWTKKGTIAVVSRRHPIGFNIAFKNLLAITRRARTGHAPHRIGWIAASQMTMPIALTIAGSDSSGGAGIQADLKTFAALGVYGASVITALTAQNTNGVSAIHQLPSDFVTAQIDAVFSDLDVKAVKIGMVAQLATIDAIVAGLVRWAPKHVVLDPVMVATSGDRLLASDAVEGLRTKLISRASLITPNLPEAAALLGEPVAVSEAAIESQGKRLLAMGCRARAGHREHRLSGQRQRHHQAGRATCRNQKHPRHRMLIVLGHRSRPRERRGDGNRGSSCQGVGQRRDRGGRSDQCRPWPRTDPSFSSVLLSNILIASRPCESSDPSPSEFAV